MKDVSPALVELRRALGRADLSLPLGGADDARRTRDELVGQIDDYLLPRLAHLDAPLLVVLGGSTGAGKSTITNSVVEADVSLAGVLRPSTRTPVLVCHPHDRDWFLGGGVLPELARSTGERPTGAGLHLVTSDRLPPGLALLDAPDIDSVETANHELAAQLLGAADAWLFVTTASRYADAVPWEYLGRARERSVAMAIVVNRIPAGAADDVVPHLRQMLQANALPDVRLFAIEELASVGVGGPTSPDDAAARDGSLDGGALLDDGRLPTDTVAEVRGWLLDLVADEARRDDVVAQTLSGALSSLSTRTDAVVAAMRDQAETAADLEAISRRRYERALERLDAELAGGELLRGEVLDRWREHVGTSAVMDRVQQGVNRFQLRLRSLVGRRSVDPDAAVDEIGSNLVTLVRSHADRAALATVEAWEESAAGAALVARAARGIDRPTPGLPDRLERELEAWQTSVMQTVREQAGNKVAVARALTLGINGVGLAVMIGVFSQTGGVTGAEAGVAAGTAAVGQTLLSAIFGENAVRELVRQARSDLQLRLAGIFEVERSRFDELLAPIDDDARVDDVVTSARSVAGPR